MPKKLSDKDLKNFGEFVIVNETTKKKKKKEKKKEEQTLEEFADETVAQEGKQPIYIINNIAGKDEKDDIRAINCYGDITERMGSEVVQAMLYFNHSRLDIVEDAEGNAHEVVRPFRMYISTHGGVVSDMFSILDVMDMIKEDCVIETIGLGKVMSAGVLMLANGTKGRRKIGKNIRRNAFLWTSREQ